MPPNRFESEVESFLEGSHGDRTHIKRADHPRLHHYAGRYYPYRSWSGLRALEAPTMVGVLRHAKPSGGVSPACRISKDAIPPDQRCAGHGSRGLVPKTQTTSVKYVENRLLWAKWSALWANRSQARCVDRM